MTGRMIIGADPSVWGEEVAAKALGSSGVAFLEFMRGCEGFEYLKWQSIGVEAEEIERYLREAKAAAMMWWITRVPIGGSQSSAPAGPHTEALKSQ